MNNIPQDAHSLEVFAIKEDEQGKKWAYIGFKISNGNFEFITVPYTEPKAKKSKFEFQDTTTTIRKQ